MDTLGTIRMKLISHKNSLTRFLDKAQIRQSGSIAPNSDDQENELDDILDKTDEIAAKMESLLDFEGDDREIWKYFRKELIATGFSGDILQEHKVRISYLLKLLTNTNEGCSSSLY
jgi:hypothetical protein